jgi:hypothetical protein
MPSQQPVPPVPPRHLGWRYFVQFSLRTLLIFMTLAAVGCWWFLQPKVREEQLGQSPLRLRRAVRLMQYDPSHFPLPDPGADMIVEGGKHFAIVNVGHWRLLDQSRHLLVDGRYKDGKRHGKWTTYHTNGRKAAEGMIEAGQKVGPWQTWDEDGRLLEQFNYARSEKTPDFRPPTSDL